MKRLMPLLLVFICLLLCLCGCKRAKYEEGKSFDGEFLKSVSLENMPLPENESYSLNDQIAGQQTLCAKTDRTAFDVYVKSFVDYMQARDDIYYFGREYHEGLIAEMLPEQVVHYIGEDFSPEGDSFTFCYSLSDATIEAGSCEHICYEEKITVTLDYEDEEGVAYIRITKNGTFGSECIDESLLSPFVFELDAYENAYRLAGQRQDIAGEVTLPATYKGLPVVEIDMWAFKSDKYEDAITHLIIPDSYKIIDFKAFSNSHSLKSVVIGNGVTEIRANAFEGCINLESVTFGNSLKAIYAESFQHCEKLKDVILPASLEEITYRAFAYCKSLTSIVVPEGVTKISADAFYENDALTDIYCEIGARPEGWNEEWCGNYNEGFENFDVKITFGYQKP